MHKEQRREQSRRSFLSPLRFLLRFQGFSLELLGGFEPPTSSLPSDKMPSSRCGIRVCGRFAPKRKRSETLCSMCSVRSFPRVGHGVGQSHRHRQCGSTFSGSGMVTFCAAGNNERVSKRRHRATGRSAMLPPGGSAGFPYGSKCGSNLFQLIKKRRQHIVDDRTYDSPVGILVMMH